MCKCSFEHESSKVQLKEEEIKPEIKTEDDTWEMSMDTLQHEQNIFQN